MASYLLDRIPMGTIITFSYKKPGTPPPYIKDVLVLTTNYLGNLHGLKVTGLTPTEQEYLQMVFKAVYTNTKDYMSVLSSNIDLKKRELDFLNQERNRLLQQSEAVVVKPVPQGMMGMMQKGRQFLGSVIGRVKTFGKTQTQAVPAGQVDPRIQQEIQKNDQLLKQKQAEYDEYFAWSQEQQKKMAQIGKVPRDPYNMYHQVIKPLIGRQRMPNIYRKYNLKYISSPRIIKAPGIVYGY